MLAIAALAFGMRFAPRRKGRPATPGAPCFSVMSWNILFGNPQTGALLSFLATEPADVIALQELTPDLVERISGNEALQWCFPHQIAWEYGIGAGMGLLSRYPILEQGMLTRPPVLWARLDLGDGRTVVLVSAHPTFFPTRMVKKERGEQPWLIAILRRFVDVRFFSYDPDYRDDGIKRVRALVEPMLRQGEPLLLVGDFNVTERERAYGELTAGLQDVFVAVGSGSGHTWRPEWLARLPLPLLRIDYMLSSPKIRPLHMWVDCTPRGSDHCAIHGEFELSPE
jgi:endonuclease/exonuclease/phosphatase family metal-dependent hydrolase